MKALLQPNFARNVRLIGHSNQGGRVVQSVSARVDAADLIYSIGNNTELPFLDCGGQRQICADVLARLNQLMLDWSSCPALERLPEKGGGEWLFRVSRVPVRALFENLEGGAGIDDFLERCMRLRKQVELVLRHAGQSLVV